MNQLAKLQNTFQDCIINPNAKDSIAWVSASGRAAPATQVSIYSHAYRARLHEVLENDFPAMLMAIGEEHFQLIVNSYIENYPSHYFSLREFGRDMPDLIMNLINNNTLEKSMYWLYELSLFEWSLGQSFDAADTSLFTEQDMAEIHPESWPDVKFTLHPSVQRLNLEWNTVEMWMALTADNPEQVTAEYEGNSSWLVWREQLVTRFRSMQTDEQLAFDAVSEGKNFNLVCDALATIMDEDDVPMHAAGLLKAWITQGLISDVQ